MMLKRRQMEEATDLAQWIREQQRAGCARLVLRQKTQGDDQNVRQWALSADTDANELADTIEERAHRDASHFRGPTLYGIFSYGSDDSYADRFFLNVAGKGVSLERSMEETEAPNHAGVVSQLMRHTEASARISLAHTQDIIQQYERLLIQSNERIRALESERTAVLEMHERVMSRQHERELELARERRAEMRMGFLKDKLDTLLPVLMSKLMPASKNPAVADELVSTLIASLGKTPGQLDALFRVLTPEQQVLVGEIITTYANKVGVNDDANGAASHTEGAPAS